MRYFIVQRVAGHIAALELLTIYEATDVDHDSNGKEDSCQAQHGLRSTESKRARMGAWPASACQLF